MAEYVGVNETTLGWHLQSNHYPPLSTRLIPPCLAAIDAYNEEETDRLIDMGGELADGRTEVPAFELVSGMHLEGFLDIGAEVEL